MSEMMRAEIRDFANRITSFDELGRRAQRVLARRSGSLFMDTLIAGAVDIRNEIVLSMRNSPASGKKYRIGTNKRGKGVFHTASSPLFPPRPRSGDLIRSILMDVRFTEVEVGSIITRPAYPLFLEEGTKRMEPRPWLWPAVSKVEPRIKGQLMKALRAAALEFKG